MATYNTTIKKRNTQNTDWDTILPITVADNVLVNDTTSVGDMLTNIDSTPTSGSTNLINSGAVLTALDKKAELSHKHEMTDIIDFTGVDADTVDGLHASDFVQTDNTAFTAGSTILDWVKSLKASTRKSCLSGVYPTDIPVQAEGIVESIFIGGNTRQKVYYHQYNTTRGTIYVRDYFNNTWLNDWKSLTDADTVDGKHASDFVLNSNYNGLTTFSNANEMRTNGMYHSNAGTANVPETYGVLDVKIGAGTNDSNKWVFQTFYSSSGRIYKRQNINNGGWSAWDNFRLASVEYVNDDDYNNFTNGTVYAYSGNTNAPSSFCITTTNLGLNGEGAQIAFSVSTGIIYTRVKTAGSGWGSWKKINDGGNADTVDGIHANTALTAWGLRPIMGGTGDLAAGSSTLTQGYIYVMYE